MTDSGTPRGLAPRPHRNLGLRVAGLLSLGLFFVPLVAPFVQVVTLAFVAAAIRRRDTDTLSLSLGAGGALLGLALHLMTQYVWIV